MTAGNAATTGEQRRKGPKQGGEPSRRRAFTADSATAQEQCHPRKIFVGGLAHKTSTQQLRDYFGQFGSIVDAVVLRWPDGRSRGFGYVTFQDASSASALLRKSHEVGGRQVDVKPAVPGTNKLFIGGLPQNTTGQELREHFEKFGVVSDAVVMIDPATSRSRGFGFVCFLPGQEGADAVTTALEQYQCHRIHGKWIEVKSAAPPHKLASKDSEIGTPPGLCHTPSSEEQAELAAIAIPDLQLSVSSLSNEQEILQKQKSGYSPKKVALPVTTTATMQAAFAAMGSPPGLTGPTKSKQQLPRQPKWRSATAPAPAATWPGCYQPEPRAPGKVHSLNSAAATFIPGAVADTTGYVGTWGSCESASCNSSLSNSLQKSLEQLLRQRSCQIETDKVDTFADVSPITFSVAKHADEPQCVSPSKVFCHGG